MSWARKNPIAAFLTIAFGIPWIGWTAREVLPLDDWFSGEALHRVRWTLFYFGWGVLVAGFAMNAATGGKHAVGALVARCFQWRASPFWWAYIIAAPIVFAGLARFCTAFSMGVDLGRFEPWNLWVLFTPAVLLIFTIGPLGEEVGWRGFLLPKLLETHPPMTASLLLGIIWLMWHFPLSFTSSSYAEIFQDPATWLAYLILVVCFSVQFTVIYLHTHGSLLIAMIFHWIVNARYSVIAAMYPDMSSESWNVLRNGPDSEIIVLAPWVISTFIMAALFHKSMQGAAQEIKLTGR